MNGLAQSPINLSVLFLDSQPDPITWISGQK